jgi:two-component system, LytTR family, sensor kinase
MKEPSVLEYVLLITGCLAFGGAGLYMLARFSAFFKRSIKNEILRKNIVVWLIVFCISNALLPMNGTFFYLLNKFGWGWMIYGQLIYATASTLIIYNLVRVVSQNKAVKKLSFALQTLVVLVSLIISTIAVNLPLSYFLYGSEAKSLIKYITTNAFYIATITGLIYGVINYLDIERTRKFNEKELELSRLRELKTKAELEALHSKINPHFLYNALNSIGDLSVTDGKKARKMTIALSDLFRYSINYSNNNFSTVKDEVEMANVYLQIEKIRFEDKLSYSLKVEEELNHYLVPRFVLQPIVENAVKHGLKATGQMTEINLEVKKNGAGLVINIADTGPAFPDEINPGYGVKSVYDKLDLLFPGNYEMHFSNNPVKQVSLYIHKLTKDESAI